MLANIGMATLNVHATVILLATSKVPGQMNPFSSSGRAKLHNQYERKAAK